MRTAFAVIVMGVCLAAASPAAASSNFAVTRTDDPSSGSCATGNCSLRQAITAANANSGADFVTLPSGTYTLSLGPLPTISDPVTVLGSSAATTKVTGATSAGGQAGVAVVSSSLTLVGVTLTQNSVSGSGAVSAGALAVSGTLNLIDSVVSGNTDSVTSATGAGGIAINLGSLYAVDSTISGNTKSGSAATGGGGLADNLGYISLVRTTVSGNTLDMSSGSAASAGVVINLADADIVNSTISANNVTASGSYTKIGGIRANTGTSDVTTLVNTTIAGNSAQNTANASLTGAAAFITSTLIAGGGGATGPNCVAGMTPAGGGSNLEDANTCGFSVAAGDLVNTSPQLGPLQNNGGATSTLAPALTSPAIDAVKGAAASGCLAQDQRGVARPQLAACDIGAVEVVVPPPANTSPPAVTGTPAVGQTLSCQPGSWTESPSFSFGWLRNGVLIAGANTNSLALTSADAGAAIQCRVTATFRGLSTAATSAPAGVATGLAANSRRPAITGALRRGSRVTCSPGTWSATPSFAFAWLRNGRAISGAKSRTYRPAARDVGAALQCRVVATTAGGSVAAESPPRVAAQACIVPSLKSATLTVARRRLRLAHCRAGKVTRAFSSSVASGHVIRSSPGRGANRAAGTKVGVTVSRGRR